MRKFFYLSLAVLPFLAIGAWALDSSPATTLCFQGTTGTATYTLQKIGTGAESIPTSALADRKFVEVCNSSENSGTNAIKCLPNSVTPIMYSATTIVAGFAGDYIPKGTCKGYPIVQGAGLKCIAGGSDTLVSIMECKP